MAPTAATKAGVVVTPVHPLRGGRLVVSAADRVGLGRHQGLHERDQHRGSKSGSARCRRVSKSAGRSLELGLKVIVVISFRVILSGLLKDHAVAVISINETLALSRSYHVYGLNSWADPCAAVLVGQRHRARAGFECCDGSEAVGVQGQLKVAGGVRTPFSVHPGPHVALQGRIVIVPMTPSADRARTRCMQEVVLGPMAPSTTSPAL